MSTRRFPAFLASAVFLLGGRALAQLPADDPAFHPDSFHCAPAPPADADFREALAWIEFPRFGMLVPVYEGTDDSELSRGAGLVEGTALPGVPDRRRNCVIAAHRTNYFSPLESAVRGDVLTLITGSGAEEYVVDRIVIVTPDHVELERPTRTPRLTLVTCTPFNYLGSAPKRFVVIASKRGSGPGHKKGTSGRTSPGARTRKSSGQR